MVTKEFMAQTSALLPTGKRMNPLKPELAEYYDPDQVAYIVSMRAPGLSGRFRVLTSFGDLGPEWDIGTEHRIRHDQTLRELGTAHVCAIVNFRTGETKGHMPNGTFPHWVFK